MFYVNIDQVPAGKHLYTIYFGDDREVAVEEIDVVLGSALQASEIAREVAQEIIRDYVFEAPRIFGIADQSDGYAVYDSHEGIVVS